MLIMLRILKLIGKKINIITNDIHANNCAIINIESPTRIYLDMLYKCGENSGTQVIKLIEKFAKKYGYRVHTIIVENRHGGVNTHGVPEEKLEQMKERFQIKLK